MRDIDMEILRIAVEKSDAGSGFKDTGFAGNIFLFQDLIHMKPANAWNDSVLRS